MSRAEQLRQMRLDFEQANALGLSIPELHARRKAERDALRAGFRARARAAVFGRPDLGRMARPLHAGTPVPAHAPWMMQD